MGLAAGTLGLAPAAQAAVDNCPFYATIIGTSRADTIHGTDGKDVICGMGGDDVIYGAGGDDTIYGNSGSDMIYGDAGNDDLIGELGNDYLQGGSGDDHLYGYAVQAPAVAPGTDDDHLSGGSGSDLLEGGPGDDVMFSGGSQAADGTYGSDLLYGGDGNDALLGQKITWSDQYSGGAGNDILYPPFVRLSPLGNSASGGSGNDAVILANYSSDSGSLGTSVKVPLGSNCTTSIPFPTDPQAGDKGSVSCKIPWPASLTKLKAVGSVTGTMDTDGDIAIRGSLFNGLATFKVSTWRALATVQGAWSRDICICDPQTPNAFIPYDHMIG
jgi:Ca2+-binding RTX toxin-like protein